MGVLLDGSHRSLKELVLQQLRKEIVEGVHRPEGRLTEQSLASQYGVSRGPIREALLQLEQEGLVRLLPRRGAVVTELSPLEAAEIYILRGHLEGLGVRLAREHWTDAHSDRLANLVAEMERLGTNDWLRAIELDQAFHRTIMETAGNRPLFQMYELTEGKVTACFVAVKRHLNGQPANMASMHRKIVDVLQQRDFWRAEILCMEHWAETSARFRSLVEGA